MFAAYTILNFVKHGTAKGRESKVPQLTGGIKDSIDGSEKLSTVKNSSTNGKKDLTKEKLVKAMYDGQAQALLAIHNLQGVPHRGIMVKNMCVSLIAVLSNQEIKNGKIVDQEVVNIPSGRRLVPNVGVIKAYEFNQHESMVKMLTSKNWELIEFNAFTEGQQPLFKNVSTKVLIINLRTLCINMKKKHVEPFSCLERSSISQLLISEQVRTANANSALFWEYKISRMFSNALQVAWMDQQL
uniref:Protein kinase domain-containing protein n=1 Tax=Strongyloides venezuelensis TaxID=75913 RepID=A0A0K0FQK1_STRVS